MSIPERLDRTGVLVSHMNFDGYISFLDTLFSFGPGYVHCGNDASSKMGIAGALFALVGGGAVLTHRHAPVLNPLMLLACQTAGVGVTLWSASRQFK